MIHPANWIDEYLEWTAPVAAAKKATSPYEASASEANSQGVAAYLEWTDIVRTPERASEGRGALRETILLTALKAESDCMHMLRQALEDGRASPRTMKLASDALRHAKRLLDEEREAWRDLDATRDAPGDGRSWPHALEGIAADVHALSGKVLALSRKLHH